jgi:hypothetical protein
MDTFSQLLNGPVADGNLISKAARDRLKLAGLCERGLGCNFVTMKGVEVAVALGLLNDTTTQSTIPFTPPAPPSMLKFKPDSFA